jgi:hypothetical protein
VKLRALAAACALAGALLPGVAGPAPAACAASAGHAALVVDTGSQVDRFCVPVPAGGVNGLDLIRAASDRYGLTYRFGEGGEAVCMLDGVGPKGGDCFGDYPDFWGYWHGRSSGLWTWASAGAGSHTVGPGDVEGWSWGEGQDGSSHQPPPPTPLSDVCRTAPTPKPQPAATPAGGTGPHRGGGSPDDGGGKRRSAPAPRASVQSPAPVARASPAGSPDAAAPKARPGRGGKSRPRGERPHGAATAASPSAIAVRSAEPSPVAAGSASGPRDGPPLAGIVGLAAALLVVAAAVVIARRRAPGR